MTDNNTNEQNIQNPEEASSGKPPKHLAKARHRAATARMRIGIGFGVMSVLMIFVVLFSIWTQRENASITDRLANVRTVTLKSSMTFDLGLLHSLAGLRGYMLTQNKEFELERIHAWETIRGAMRDLEKLSENWTNPENVTRLQEIQTLIVPFEKAQAEAESLMKAGDLTGATAVLVQEAAPRANRMSELAEEMIQNQQHLMEADEAILLNRNQSALMVYYFILAAAILFCILVSYVSIRSLRTTADQVQQSSLKLNSSSNQILAASSQHESTATEQSSQMSEIQATLNQAASTSTELNQTVQEMVRSSQGIAKEADEGTQYIQETNQKVQAMTESNNSVGTKLRTLHEKIEGIGKILNTILSVADQTNLLSLNAAIEAAKAGEQGKGFNVVAQEIRRLADQTAQSSKEISAIVNEVQAASSSAIMVMDKSAQDVSESTEVVKSLADRFAGITDKVQNTLPQMEATSQSVNELATGNKQIAASVTEMNKALKLTVGAAKQLKLAAYDMTEMGQQLRSSAAEL